jgi:ornithine cyclodeaminase/alanine dehydrogenase-like protein (mu-crystallin family)
VLPYTAIAELLSKVSLAAFVTDLADAIALTYEDNKLDSITRTGWPSPPDTLEVMGCQSTDFTCVKLISSNPSLTASALPTVTGTMVCTEVGTDTARLVCDAAILTPLRTASSTAVIMRQVVPDVERIGIIGAGREGACHGFTLATTLKNVTEVLLYDLDPKQSRRAAREVTELLARNDVGAGRQVKVYNIDITNIESIYTCDTIVTATYGDGSVISNRPPNRLADGTFIAAIGSDLVGKRELDFTVYDSAKFIADDLTQCLHEGELQHAAIKFRLDTAGTGSHRGTLLDGRIVSVADLLSGNAAFARRREPVTVYDSTGFSGQDLGLARVLLRALKAENWPTSVWNPPRSLPLTSLYKDH